jgi:hypothetical protein
MIPASALFSAIVQLALFDTLFVAATRDKAIDLRLILQENPVFIG